MSGQRDDRDWVEVFSTSRIEDAWHAVRVLAAAGIRTEVWGSGSSMGRQQLFPTEDFSVGPHRVATAPGDAERAREVLRAHTVPRPRSPEP